MKGMLRIKDMLEIRTRVFRGDEGFLLILLINHRTGRQVYIESGPGDRVDYTHQHSPSSESPDAEQMYQEKTKQIARQNGNLEEEQNINCIDLSNRDEVEVRGESLETWFVDDDNEHEILRENYAWVTQGVEPLEVVKSDKYALKTTEHQLGEW